MAIKKFRFRPEGVNDYSDILHPETSADVVLLEDTAGNFSSNNVEGALAELFTSVSDGKNAIAAAITDMGQSASGSNTFAQLAAKIKAISSDANAAVSDVLKGKTFYAGGQKRTGTLELTGNATAAQVLSGYTFYNTNPKSKLTGSMSNRGAVVITPSTNNQTIQAGYHNGSGYVKGDSNLTAENIKNGVSIFGVTGTFKGNMVKSIQTGQVSLSGSSPRDVTISSVDVNSSIVLVEHLGCLTTDTFPDYFYAYFYGVEISASNRLTFRYYVNSGGPYLALQWKVIEFYPEAVRSLQKGTASGSTGAVNISSVTIEKSLVIVTGGFAFKESQAINGTATFQSRGGYLYTSSRIYLEGYGGTDCRWQVIEFY